MNCLTKLFQQKRRRIGYILAFSDPMISKRDSSDNGYEEKLNYKRSNTILITYKSKQYKLHTGDRNLNKIKSGIFPKLYYASETDYLFFEGDYLPVGYAQAALIFTFIFSGIGTLIWRKQLDDDISKM